MVPSEFPFFFFWPNPKPSSPICKCEICVTLSKMIVTYWTEETSEFSLFKYSQEPPKSRYIKKEKTMRCSLTRFTSVDGSIYCPIWWYKGLNNIPTFIFSQSYAEQICWKLVSDITFKCQNEWHSGRQNCEGQWSWNEWSFAFQNPWFKSQKFSLLPIDEKWRET